MMADVALKQVAPPTAPRRRQRDTLRSLKLGRIGQQPQHTDTPQLQGMLRVVEHLVEVRQVSDGSKRVGLHNLKPNPGSRRPRKRLGRGKGSGHGKTSGRGHKGAGAALGQQAQGRPTRAARTRSTCGWASCAARTTRCRCRSRSSAPGPSRSTSPTSRPASRPATRSPPSPSARRAWRSAGTRSRSWPAAS